MPGAQTRPALADESIFNILPTQQTVPAKQARYKSKFDGTVDPHSFELGTKDIKAYATFGKPDGYNASSPDEFIRSRSQPFHQTRQGLGQTSPKVRRKEALPDKHDKPLMGLSSGRNFISTNALDVIHAKPKQAEPEFFYTQKQDYGKVPDYLQRAKQLQEEAIEAKALREIETADQANKLAPLSEQARQELLSHLKTKWAGVNSSYLKLPFSLDSATKLARKEALEKELQSIEQDIKLLQRGNILVAQDC